ncbi:DoxX family protein [Leeuwenhoekiella sp. MAR_2009_132]|uniref:DoxX family protein n=1 Tax=Leeuwenhoekiella sp. MAR_2009_132 TaxID=1392489 RepID=UPI00048B5688|nr:DoxX family protein [Leeuwenhoekiella sp. MAR_2009_132]
MKRKIISIVSILFGLLFINSGLNKFFNYMPMPEDLPQEVQDLFAALMSFGWLLPLIALVEIIAGILVMIPRTQALGYIMIFPIMVGIVLTHIVNMPEGLLMAVILMIINIGMLYENRAKIKPLF